MRELWYCVIDGVRRGPMSWEELRACVLRGEVRPDDYVWTAEYGGTWRRARDVAGLLAQPPPLVMMARPVEELPPPQPLSGDDFEPSCFMALRQAWQRTHAVLLEPFDIGLWLAVGLCAWFAAVGRFEWSNLLDMRELANSMQQAVSEQGVAQAMQVLPRLLRTRLAAAVTVSAVAITVFFMVVMMWVRARGALMFVDRWHRPRAPFTETWRALRRQANSLFATRLAITAVFLALLAAGGAIGGVLRVAEVDSWTPPLLLPRLAWAGGMALLALAMLVAGELDRQFVVPVLCWRRGTAPAAWRLVLSFCNSRPFALLRFLAMRLAVEIVIAMGLMASTLFTCCLFWVVMQIPYFGSVVLLPVSFFRCGLGISLLGQWKPDLPPKPGRTR